MTTKIKISVLIISLFLGFSASQSMAQSVERESKTTISIETDPSTFIFKGYAFHLRIKPKNSLHFIWGLGTYALNLPDVLINMNEANKDKGWEVRINSAYSLFGEYYLKEANKKWFVGMQLGVQNYQNSNDNSTGKKSNYSNLLVMPSIGYTWQSTKFPLYVKPWFGIGYTNKISGDNSIENRTYDIAPLVPFLTLHLGYTFK